MSLSWLKRWVKDRFPAGARKTTHKTQQRPRSVRLSVEALEERTLLDGNPALGFTALGLHDAALVWDSVAQLANLGNPGLNSSQHQRAGGYLASNLSSLIGATVSAIPGASTTTIGQAFTTAGDLGRLTTFLLTNGVNKNGTPLGIALQDLMEAKYEVMHPAPGNNPRALAVAVQNSITSGSDIAGLNTYLSSLPPGNLVTPALNSMVDVILSATDPIGGPPPYPTDPNWADARGGTGGWPAFSTAQGTVHDALPPNVKGLFEAFSDVLALAGDISNLSGAPPIVGDALVTAHDLIAVDLDENPAPDVLSLYGDSLTLVNDALPGTDANSQPLAVTVSVPNGTNPVQSGTIATFSDPNVAATQAPPPASDYMAYIDWGDGSSSIGQVAAGSSGGANYVVNGNHVYTTPGDYALSVVVAGNATQGQGSQDVPISSGGSGASGQVQGITVAGQTLTSQGSQTVRGTVATFYAPASGSYSATVDWGDGATSTGQIVANPDGSFSVTGSHTYSQAGSYATNVLVSDNNGNVASALGTAATASPTSSVNPLPAVETSPSFTVSWSGSDPGGPGISSYTVYFSDNGGAFTPWLANTTQTSAAFTGQSGHSYAFYSVAADGLGVTQPTPTAPQATTIVQLPPPPWSSVNPLPGTVNAASFIASWSGSDPGGPGISSYTVYFSDNGGAFTPWLANTTQTSAAFTGQSGHRYSFFSVATDNFGQTQPTPGVQATTYVWVPPAPPQEPPLLQMLLSFGSKTLTVNANGTETIMDNFFGLPWVVATFDSATGSFEDATWLGVDITLVIELLK